MFVANQSNRLSASYWSKLLSHLLVLQRGLRDIEILWYSQARKFPQPQSKNYFWNRLTFLHKDLQLLEGLEEFFRGNSRKTLDCRVCSMIKNTAAPAALCYQKLFVSRSLVVAIRVNCAAISVVFQSSTIVKSYNSSEERIISFERTKTNHDKLPRENNNLITTRQITLHVICIFFGNNFREFGTLNAVCEEIIKLHIFIESRQEYF